MMSDTPPSPFELLHKLQTEGGVRLIIVGGFAVNSHGFGRFTMDLDCMAVMDDMFRVESAFKAAGYTRIPASPMYSTFRHPDASPPVVDILLVDSTTFDREVVGKACAGCFRSPQFLRSHVGTPLRHEISLGEGEPEALWQRYAGFTGDCACAPRCCNKRKSHSTVP
jgi:hypothetical protein